MTKQRGRPRGPTNNYPDWLKGYAHFLYVEKRMGKMQVHRTLQENTGFNVNVNTLKTWLYRGDLRNEREMDT